MELNAIGNRITFRKEDLPFVLIGMLHRFSNRYQALADGYLGDMSWKQLLFLRVVDAFEKPPTLNEMAKLLGCSSQNTNAFSLKLQKMGFVFTEQDPEDRRRQIIYLTVQAKDYLSKKGDNAQNFARGLFNAVTPDETETILCALIRLLDSLDDLEKRLNEEQAPHRMQSAANKERITI